MRIEGGRWRVPRRPGFAVRCRSVAAGLRPCSRRRPWTRPGPGGFDASPGRDRRTRSRWRSRRSARAARSPASPGPAGDLRARRFGASLRGNPTKRGGAPGLLPPDHRSGEGSGELPVRDGDLGVLRHPGDSLRSAVQVKDRRVTRYPVVPALSERGDPERQARRPRGVAAAARPYCRRITCPARAPVSSPSSAAISPFTGTRGTSLRSAVRVEDRRVARYPVVPALSGRGDPERQARRPRGVAAGLGLTTAGSPVRRRLR